MAKALAKKESTAMVGWEARLAEDAKEAAASEVVSGRFISCRGAQFSFNGTTLKNPLDVIVMQHAHENAYYEGEWDPDAPAAPVCFALSIDGKDMKPHELSAKPQHPKCAGCPKNEFGTADKGKGKACKNTRRLALMMPGQLDNPIEAEIAYLRPPVTSVKGWSDYVNGLASALKLPPYAVTTTIINAPDPKSQFKLSFKVAGKLDLSQVHEAFMAKRQELKETILFPYQAQAQMPAEEKPVRRRKY